jgi:DNA-binding NarL/FixJ family response regulator
MNRGQPEYIHKNSGADVCLAEIHAEATGGAGCLFRRSRPSNFALGRIAGESNGNKFADYLQRLMRACESSWTGGVVRSLLSIPETSPLTSRESDVLRFVAAGQSNKRVAQMLGVSPETVKSHIKSIFTKLKVDNRMQAVIHARRLGLLE